MSWDNKQILQRFQFARQAVYEQLPNSKYGYAKIISD